VGHNATLLLFGYNPANGNFATVHKRSPTHEAASIEVIRIANLAKMLPVQQSLNSEDNRNNISAYSPSLH
jgi:hypothetical protein